MINKRSARKAAIGIVALSLFIALIAFLIPAVPTPGREANINADHWRTGIAALLASLYVGSAIEFLSGLKSFRAELRTAYRFIAVGIILFSVGFVQLPLAGLLGQWDSAWITGGGAMLPFVIAGVLMYVGVRKFGLLLHLRGFLMSFWKVIAATTLAMIVIYAIATVAVQHDVEGTNAYIAVIGWAGAYLLVCSLITRRIAGKIGPDYQLAMRRLMVALLVFFMASIHEAVTSLFVSNGDPFVDYGGFMLPFVATGFLLVWAGEAFRLIGVPSLAAQAEVSGGSETVTDKDYIDSITTLAGLASRPEDIDPILDDMRTITSAMQPGDTLSDTHKKDLLKVYARIEEYLINNDPLRNFTRDELREHSAPAFRILLANAD